MNFVITALEPAKKLRRNGRVFADTNFGYGQAIKFARALKRGGVIRINETEGTKILAVAEADGYIRFASIEERTAKNPTVSKNRIVRGQSR